MCVCVFPETTTHFESLLSRIKAASKERKRERRTTTTNALRLVGLGRRSPGYVFCILLLLKRCEEITTTHSFIIVAFFLSCFFIVSISNEIKMGIKSSMVSSSQTTQSNQKRGSCEKSAKPNNKEKIDENPKPRSEKKEAHTKRQKL